MQGTHELVQKNQHRFGLRATLALEDDGAGKKVCAREVKRPQLDRSNCAHPEGNDRTEGEHVMVPLEGFCIPAQKKKAGKVKGQREERQSERLKLDTAALSNHIGVADSRVAKRSSPTRFTRLAVIGPV